MQWQKWVLNEITHLVASLRIGGVSAIRVWDATAQGYRLTAAHGEQVQGLAPLAPGRESLTGAVARSGLPSLATVGVLDPSDRLEFGTSLDVALYYGMPIRSQEDVVGVLNVMFPFGVPPSDDEREAMAILAGHAGAAIAASNVFARLDEASYAHEADRRGRTADAFIDGFRTPCVLGRRSWCGSGPTVSW